MLLLTWHGTLLCRTDAGALSQGSLDAPPLAFEGACLPGTRLTHPALGALDILPGATPGSLALRHAGRFLSAGPHAAPPVFDRAAIAHWESFLPITEADLVLLTHIRAQSWILRETRMVLRKRDVALLQGFRLALGDMQVQLAQLLPSLSPANRGDGLTPDTLFVGLPDGAEVALCVAHPRHSQLVDTATWPVRARRQAEMMALAAHRFVLGHEPLQAELDDAAAWLMANRGAAGLLDLLETLAATAEARDPTARQATPPTPATVPPATDTPAAALLATDTQATATPASLTHPSHAPLAVPHAAESRTPLGAAQDMADRGDPRTAMSMLERLANNTPQDPAIWHAIGTLCSAEGEYAAAEAAYRRCLAIEPAHVEAGTALAGLLANLGRRLAAIALFTTVIDAAPGAQEARALLANLYVELPWRDRADALLSAPEAGQLNGWKAATHTRNQATIARLRASIVPLQAAHEAGTLAWPDRIQLIDSLFALGELERCRAMVDAAMALDPAKPGPHEYRARLLMRQAGIDAAIAYLRPLQGGLGHYRRVATFIANMLLEAGRLDEARAMLQPHLAQTPAPEIYTTLLRIAVWQDDRSTLHTLSKAWMATNAHESPTAMFALVEARAAGRIRRLADIPEAAAPLDVQVVQYWHSTEIPRDVADAMASWSFHNPGIGHVVFDDLRARDYLAREFGGAVLDCFDAARHPAMRSDLFRLAYLSRQGGIYIDADEICRRDMRRVFACLLDVEFIGWLAPSVPPYLFNGFIAVRPGSPIVQHALIEATRLLGEHRAAGIRSDIWQVTGPGLLTRAVARHDALAGRDATLLLLTDNEFRHFARTDEMLAYKHADGGNWRVA